MRPRARVDLELHLGAAGKGSEGLELGIRAHAHVDAGVHSRGEIGVGIVDPRQQRRVDTRRAQLVRFREVCHSQPRGSPGERGTGGLHGAVAVAVRLDDGHRLHAREPAQQFDVVAYGAEVDSRLAHQGASATT